MTRLCIFKKALEFDESFFLLGGRYCRVAIVGSIWTASRVWGSMFHDKRTFNGSSDVQPYNNSR